MIDEILEKISEIRSGNDITIFIAVKSEEGEYSLENIDDKYDQLKNELGLPEEISQRFLYLIEGALGEYPDSNFEISLIENCSEAEARGIENILKEASNYIELSDYTGEWECRYFIV